MEPNVPEDVIGQVVTTMSNTISSVSDGGEVEAVRDIHCAGLAWPVLVMKSDYVFGPAMSLARAMSRSSVSSARGWGGV